MAGRILQGDKDFLSLPLPDRARLVSIVQTQLGHTGLLRSRELVKLGRFPHVPWHGHLSPADQAAVEEAMQTTGCQHLADRRVETLSDGERQRVVLARAVAQATPIILLDEPTAFLDVNGKLEMLQTLRSMTRERRMAIAVSTHDLTLALQLADELWIFDRDTIIAGAPDAPATLESIDRAFPGIRP